MTSTGMRTHQCGELRAEQIGQTVSLCGWVATRREHGEHLAFIDLRDHTGVTQCVVDNTVDVRPEYVVRVTGQSVFNAGTGAIKITQTSGTLTGGASFAGSTLQIAGAVELSAGPAAALDNDAEIGRAHV